MWMEATDLQRWGLAQQASSAGQQQTCACAPTLASDSMMARVSTLTLQILAGILLKYACQQMKLMSLVVN